MKPIKKLPAKKNNKTGSSKLNSFQKFLLFLGFLFIAFTVLRPVVVLFLGLLPTLTIVVIDTKNINNFTAFGNPQLYLFKIFLLFHIVKTLYQRFGYRNKPLGKVGQLCRAVFALDAGIEPDNGSEFQAVAIGIDVD